MKYYPSIATDCAAAAAKVIYENTAQFLPEIQRKAHWEFLLNVTRIAINAYCLEVEKRDRRINPLQE